MNKELSVKYTHKTTQKFARLICDECNDLTGDGGERFLTKEQYETQMWDAHHGWRCPDCRTYPCRWDDDYFELPVKN